MRVEFATGTFYLGDCFDVMATLAPGSVDMVLNDPPYGTTACAWDSVLPLDQMWPEYWRLARANAAVVMTASQPFTSALVMSQAAAFKHEWVWRKNAGSNFAAVKWQPMKEHESVLVFGKSKVQYFPIMQERSEAGQKMIQAGVKSKATDTSGVFGGANKGYDNSQRPELRVPSSVQNFNRERGLHPTQKPVALFEYLIRTYTNPGELVLDNTAGSGTTAIAAIQSGRRWICIERDQGYFDKAVERVRQAEAALGLTADVFG